MKLLTVITFSSTSIYVLKIILLHVHIQKDKWWLLRPPFISSLWILDDPVDDQRLHVSVTCNAQQGQSKYLFWTLVFYFHLICMYYHLFTVRHYSFLDFYIHIEDYIAVHIQKDKWWLLRPPFISSLWISDDLVDESLCSRGFTGVQQEESKYFGLIFNVSILLSSHCRYYHLSSKHSLLYMIAFSSTPICISNIILLFIFETR